MPEKRLEKCRKSYEDWYCIYCGKPGSLVCVHCTNHMISPIIIEFPEGEN